MRTGIAITGLALVLLPGAALAQQAAPAPAQAAPSCPSSGYDKAYFGAFGDNDGVLRSYEIAGPCISAELRTAAEAIGMGRFRPVGVKNVTTIRFQAKGPIANARGVIEDASKVDIAISYVIPAARISVDTIVKGKPQTSVRVFADKTAWDETAPGIGGKVVKGAVDERAPLVKLTPFGALWSVIEAEGKAVVTKDGDRTIVTGASPYDGYPVKLTLDAKHLPVAVEVKAHGRTYAATFEDYRSTWESAYLVIFPSHIVWTLNGKPLANLTVTAFHSNPYVIFPAPTTQAQASETPSSVRR
jgi:hypothetical protein